MTVLFNIIARDADGKRRPLERFSVPLAQVADVAAAMALLVESSEGGRTRRGKLLIRHPAEVPAELGRWAEKLIETAHPIAGTDTVSDAPTAEEEANNLMTRTVGNESPPVLTPGDGYPASHFDNASVCGAHDVDRKHRCKAIRGHRGMHAWRAVLAAP